MPAAYVNGTSRNNLGVTSGNLKTTTYGFNTIAGNSGVIGIFYKGTGNVISLQDSVGNNYFAEDCGRGLIPRGASGTMGLFGCSNLIAGTDPTITATFNAAQTEVDMYPAMYSGCDPTGMWNTAAATSDTVGSSGTVITSAAFTPGIAAGAVVVFAVTNDTLGLVGNIGGVLATGRLIPAGWATILEDRIFSASLGAGITAAVGMSTSYTEGRLIVGIIKAGSSLTKKFRIPTALADGTQRRLLVFSDTGLATKLTTPQLVTASGGFFKYADVDAVVGTKYPAVLWDFGADQNVDARGGPCWATGIEE